MPQQPQKSTVGVDHEARIVDSTIGFRDCLNAVKNNSDQPLRSTISSLNTRSRRDGASAALPNGLRGLGRPSSRRICASHRLVGLDQREWDSNLRSRRPTLALDKATKRKK